LKKSHEQKAAAANVLGRAGASTTQTHGAGISAMSSLSAGAGASASPAVLASLLAALTSQGCSKRTIDGPGGRRRRGATLSCRQLRLLHAAAAAHGTRQLQQRSSRHRAALPTPLA
jgi:hypothetical protein